MDIIEILIAACAAAVVIFTLVYNIRRAKQGKSSCGGCQGKSGGSCTGCAKYKEPDKKDQ